MAKKLKTNLLIASSLILTSVAGMGICLGIGSSKMCKSSKEKDKILNEYHYELSNLEYKNQYINDLRKKLENQELTQEEYNEKTNKIPDLDETVFVMNNEAIPEETKTTYSHVVVDGFNTGISLNSSSVVFFVPFGIGLIYIDKPVEERIWGAFTHSYSPINYLNSQAHDANKGDNKQEDAEVTKQ